MSERDRLADLVEFAVGPLEEMHERGHYWADAADDEDSKVTPDQVIAAIRAAADALRGGSKPDGLVVESITGMMHLAERDRDGAQSPGPVEYHSGRIQAYHDCLTLLRAAHPQESGRRVEGVAWKDGDSFCQEPGHQESWMVVPSCECQTVQDMVDEEEGGVVPAILYIQDGGESDG